jgi:hypothetical protein
MRAGSCFIIILGGCVIEADADACHGEATSNDPPYLRMRRLGSMFSSALSCSEKNVNHSPQHGSNSSLLECDTTALTKWLPATEN